MDICQGGITPPHPSSLFIQSKQADLQWLTQSTMFLVFFEDIET